MASDSLENQQRVYDIGRLPLAASSTVPTIGSANSAFHPSSTVNLNSTYNNNNNNNNSVNCNNNSNPILIEQRHVDTSIDSNLEHHHQQQQQQQQHSITQIQQQQLIALNNNNNNNNGINNKEHLLMYLQQLMKNNGLSNNNNNDNDVAGIVERQQNSSNNQVHTNPRNFDHELAVGNGGGGNSFTIVNGVLKLADHQRSSTVATINEHLIATTIAAATVVASSGATALSERTPRSTISTSPSISSTSITVNTQNSNSPTTATNNIDHSTSLAALVNRHSCTTSSAAKIGATTLASLNTATPETGYGGATQVDNTSSSSSRISAFLHSHLQQQQQQNHQTKESCNGCRELKREVEELRKMISQFLDVPPTLNNHAINRISSVTSNDPINFIGRIPSNGQQQQCTLSRNNAETAAVTQMMPNLQQQQQQADHLVSLGNLGSIPQRLLPWLLTSGLLSSSTSPPLAAALQQHIAHQQQQKETNEMNARLLEQLVSSQNTSINSSSTPPTTVAMPSHNLMDQFSLSNSNNMQSDITANGNDITAQHQQHQHSKFAELVQAAAALYPANRNIGGTANSAPQIADGSTIDATLVDGNETSSSVSSTNTQLMLVSPQQQQLAFNQNVNNKQQHFTNISTNSSPSRFDAQAQLAAAVAAAVTRPNNNIMSHLLSLPQMANNGIMTPSNNNGTSFSASQILHQNAALQTSNNLSQTQQNSTLAQLHASLLLRQQQEQQKAAAATALVLQRQQQQQQQQQIQHLRAQQQQLQNHNQQQHHRKHSAVQESVNGSVNDGSGERVHVEKRRAGSDDYVRSIRQENLTEEFVADITIPVPQAMQADPFFRPLPEEQVVQQVIQNKKYENVHVSEIMAQLSKKLAEKRVFGSRLMAQTTVAAPNHSSYNNLPRAGILYIQYVCRKVLSNRLNSDDEFWEYFREAMRKLAARCRRVRHAKKPKLTGNTAAAPKQPTQHQLRQQQQQQQLLMEQQQQNRLCILQQQQNVVQQQVVNNKIAELSIGGFNLPVATAEVNVSGVIAENEVAQHGVVPNSVLLNDNADDDDEPMDVADVSLSGGVGEDSISSPLSPQTPLSTSSRTHTLTPTLCDDRMIDSASASVGIKIEELDSNTASA